MGQKQGFRHSAASRAKMSVSRSGKPQSEAHKAARFAALQGYWDSMRLPAEERTKRIKARRRAKTLKSYGLDTAAYAAMLIAQGEVCAICKEKPDEKALVVDHCHTTGTVRGLLCRLCNLVIGNAKERPELLQAAVTYLNTTK